MTNSTLATLVVEYIEFLELSNDDVLDLDLAVSQMEGIAASLAEASEDERKAVREAARARLAWLLRDPDEHGYSPRKLVTPAHRALLEGIASWEAFDGPSEASKK